MTRNDVVRTWADRWRTLRAWNRSLENVTIHFSERRTARRLGTCWPMQQRVVLYPQDVAGALSTVLHEFAHAVEIEDHHGARWQARYAAAVSEVTGVQLPGGIDGDYQIICGAGRDAIWNWWKQSGNHLAMKLLGVA